MDDTRNKEASDVELNLAVVVVIDLEGFTDFSSSLSSFEFSRFVENFKGFVRETTEKYGGKVIKFLGDGAIAIFQVTEKAVRASLEIVQHYRETQTKAKAFVNVGEVIIDKDDVFGHDVNFSFRMIEFIKGGTLALSESAFHILKDKKGFAPSRALSVKGVGDNIRIFVYGDPEKSVRETDDVKFSIKEASLLDRFMSFYLDVLIFVSSLGLVSAFSLKELVGFKQIGGSSVAYQSTSQVDESQPEVSEEGQRGSKGQKELKILEVETPIGKVKAGRGKIDIETQRGEIHTEPGRLEIKLGERKRFAISYLHLSGIEVFLFAVYLSLSWYFLRGRTPGEWIMKLRVEKIDRTPLDLKSSFLRAILLIFMVLPAGLGIIIPLILTREKRLIHDILTKTVVVRS